MRLFASTGVKRYLSTVIGTGLVFLSSVPVLSPVVSILFVASGALGAVGLVHSNASKNLFNKSKTPITVGATLVALYAIAENIHACEPYLPLLKLLITLTGGAALATGLKDSSLASKDTHKPS